MKQNGAHNFQDVGDQHFKAELILDYVNSANRNSAYKLQQQSIGHLSCDCDLVNHLAAGLPGLEVGRPCEKVKYCDVKQSRHAIAGAGLRA